MHLHCTQKLLKALAFQKEQLTPPTSEKLHGWHAHIVSIARSKTIIAINDQNFFAIIMPEIRKERLKNLSIELHRALSATLKSEGFEKSHTDILFGEGILFSKSHDRQVVGIINQIVKDIKYQIERTGGWNSVNILELTQSVNRTPWLATSKNPIFPIEQMNLDLKTLLH